MALTSPGVVKSTNEILVKLAPEINIVKQFAYDISNVVADYGDKIRVALVTGGVAESFSDSCADRNYEHATGELSDVFVTLNDQPKSTITISQMEKLELQNDSFWTRFAEAGANSIGKAISTAIGGKFTTSACAGGKVVLAFDDTKSEAYNRKQLAMLRTSCKGRIADTVLLLNPTNYATMLSLCPAQVYGNNDPILNGYVEKLYGFKAVVCAYDLPDGVTGALVPSNGLAIAIRPVAIPDPAAYPEADIVKDDENGFAISVLRHTAFATGKAYLNATCLVGAELTQPENTCYLAAS